MIYIIHVKAHVNVPFHAKYAFNIINKNTYSFL